MRYLFALLLPLFFVGCVVEYNPNSRPHAALNLSNLIWSADGSKVIAFADSISSDGNYFHRIRVYDMSGTLLQSYPAPSDLYGSSSIWGSADDSTFFTNTYSGSSYNNYFINRNSISGIWISTVAGGMIYGQSSDRQHFFIGPYGYQSSVNSFLVVDVSGSKSRLQKSWSDPAPQIRNAVWIGNKSIGYFHYNPLNLVEFIIVDTNGAKLDSFDIGGLSDRDRPFYGPGALYFAGYLGITKLDSISKSQTTLTEDYIWAADMASDGSLMTYTNATHDGLQLSVINPKTGSIKKIAGNAGQYLNISPSNDHLAYIDQSVSSFDKLVIIPVSAP